jgi:predicted transcriptional regulator YheO
MAKNRKVLSAQDKLILESYKTTMDGLAAYYGEAFEIVLHNLVDLNHSIIKIVNGFHSGRKEGAPITDFALSMLEKIRSDNISKKPDKNPTPYTTYISSSKYGKPVKSTTIVIFGENHRAVGLLCINLYLDSPIFALAPFLGGFTDSPEELIDENFITNSDELIFKALEKVKAAVMADDTIPAVLKNKEIITRLYYQGIFKLKDAVITIAESLNISKNTVYLHLRPLEKN